MFVHRKQGLFLSVHVDGIKNGWKEAEKWLQCGRNWWKNVVLTNQHHFLTMCIWDVLNVNANRMKHLLNDTQQMFDSRISAGATDKLPGWQQPHTKTVACSHDMEGHARKCNDRYCLLANKKWSSYTQVQVFAGLITNSRRKNLNQLENYQKYALKLSWNACTWHELGDQTLYGLSTNLLEPSQNGLRLATEVWQDWFHTFITQMTTDKIVMCCPQPSIVDWVYPKTQTLLAILRTRKQPQDASFVFLEEQLSLSVGCARNKRQCPALLQNLKSFRWMLDCERMDFLLSTSGMW